MKKQSIVLASILKPVDDTRMLEKMGQSLAATGQWHVHIIGYTATPVAPNPDINFYMLGKYSRISWARVLAPFSVFAKFLALKPKVIIIGTHELLITAVLYKILSGAKLIYDIRENYYLNIISTNAFPLGLCHLIAWEVRLREWLTAPFVNRFVLAEKTYSIELPFLGNRFSIIENKCKLPQGFKRSSVPSGIKLLFSGSIDESTGVFEAIELAKQMHQANPSVKLTLIGYCALLSIRKRIMQAIEGHTFITVIGLTSLVPHSQILEEISAATAGLIFYPPSNHNQNRIPTKLFEYMACRLPIIYDEGATWKNLVINNQGGLAIDYKNPNSHLILNRLIEDRFYIKPTEELTWQSEEGRFLEVVNVSCYRY